MDNKLLVNILNLANLNAVEKDGHVFIKEDGDLVAFRPQNPSHAMMLMRCYEIDLVWPIADNKAICDYILDAAQRLYEVADTMYVAKNDIHILPHGTVHTGQAFTCDGAITFTFTSIKRTEAGVPKVAFSGAYAAKTVILSHQNLVKVIGANNE